MERKYIIGIVVAVVIVIILLALLYNRNSVSEPVNPPRHSVIAQSPTVSNIKVEQIDGQTKVSWDPVEGASHYTMYYSENQNFDKTKVNTHNPIQDTAMILGSDVPRGYYFKVSAVKNIGGQTVETNISDEHYMFLDVV